MTILHLLHQIGVTRLLASGPVTTLISRQRGVASIFMLHRFGKARNGHDPLVVRRLLGWLRRNRYELLDLEELFRRLGGAGPPVRHAVAFTIDDGYDDQAEVAAPLFSEYGVPVTTFLTTGFLDGAMWLWWDQIEYILQSTRLDRFGFVAEARPLDLDLTTPAGRRSSAARVAAHCKALPEAERLAAISELSRAAMVALPEVPPPEYRPMTWEQVRRCEAAGMRFGPHTVTHPILARVSDAQAKYEIEESWTRLSREVARPVPIFCYPNGTRDDFGPREFATIHGLGLLGAVTAEPGYASVRDLREPDGAFQVPRFGFSEEHNENLRYSSRLEWLWQKVRLRSG